MFAIMKQFTAETSQKPTKEQRQHRRKMYWWNVRYMWKRRIKKLLNTRILFIQRLDPIPAGDNPFLYDLCHMGTSLPRDITIMHPGYDRKEDPLPMEYIIVINTRNGTRFHIPLPQE